MASQNSEGLRKYHSQKNNPDAFLQFFEGNTANQIDDIFAILNEICGHLATVDLNTPEAIQEFVPLLPVFDRIAENYANLHFLEIDRVNRLATLFQQLDLINSTERAEQFGEILSEYCSLDDDERTAFQDKYLEPRLAHIRLRNASGLGNNNLRTMTNYLNFRSTSGGKRKKTRKVRKQ